MYAIHTFDFEHAGRKFRANILPDEDMGAPWVEHAGHGIVSDGNRTEKLPSEVRIDSGERHTIVRFYDVTATLKLAKRDAWGINDDEKAKLKAKLGRAPNARERTVQAVHLDMLRMRGWCCDEWSWIGVEVYPLTDDGDELKSKAQSLWGIESDSVDYHKEVAAELAEQCK